VAALTAEIEEMLLPLGARPHWGKIMHARAAELEPLYPKLPAFRNLARSYDPSGKFRNDFLDAHVLG
jgi:alditol oxidase